MSDFKKQLTEQDLINWLRAKGGPILPPLRFKVLQTSKRIAEKELDAVVEISWQARRYRFAAEAKALSTPLMIEGAIGQLQRIAKDSKLLPLLVTSYLPDEQLDRLEREQISGLDLCGNGVIIVPGELFVRRSGEPNKYPRGTPIQNVYLGSSSLVARAFLLRGEYESSQDLLEEIARRGGSVTPSTVSKVCGTLVEDLIVASERAARKKRLRLLQPEKLLSQLAENYKAPTVTRRFQGTIAADMLDVAARLLAWEQRGGGQVIRTGADSVDRYATMIREPIASYYCTQLADLTRYLGGALTETLRFANFELVETSDPTVYFDRGEELAASPIQCYLELRSGDKRQRETAEQASRNLLAEIKSAKPSSS